MLLCKCPKRHKTTKGDITEGENNMARQQDLNEQWFFDGGYEGMDKLQQVDYLVCECGWSEDSACELIYGCCE